MRTRAVAVASERSNAIGSVELECTPLGLIIVYHGVGAFQEGYAPGALTSGTRVVVPWASVKESSLEGDRLFLHVDEALTPHHRLVLAGFSVGDPPDANEVARQRLLVRIGTGAAMVIAALFAGLTARPRRGRSWGAASPCSSAFSPPARCSASGSPPSTSSASDSVARRRTACVSGSRRNCRAYVPSLARSLRPDAPDRRHLPALAGTAVVPGALAAFDYRGGHHDVGGVARCRTHGGLGVARASTGSARARGTRDAASQPEFRGTGGAGRRRKAGRGGRRKSARGRAATHRAWRRRRRAPRPRCSPDRAPASGAIRSSGKRASRG